MKIPQSQSPPLSPMRLNFSKDLLPNSSNIQYRVLSYTQGCKFDVPTKEKEEEISRSIKFLHGCQIPGFILR